jgi:hypothetical protein
MLRLGLGEERVVLTREGDGSFDFGAVRSGVIVKIWNDAASFGARLASSLSTDFALPG